MSIICSQSEIMQQRNIEASRRLIASLKEARENSMTRIRPNSTSPEDDIPRCLSENSKQPFLNDKLRQQNITSTSENTSYVTMLEQYHQPKSREEPENIYEIPFQQERESNRRTPSPDHLYDNPNVYAKPSEHSRPIRPIANSIHPDGNSSNSATYTIRKISSYLIPIRSNKTDGLPVNQRSQQAPHHKSKPFSGCQTLPSPSSRAMRTLPPIPTGQSKLHKRPFPIPSYDCSSSAKITRRNSESTSEASHSNSLYYYPSNHQTDDGVKMNIFKSNMGFCLCFFKNLSYRNAAQYCLSKGIHGTFILRPSEKDKSSHALTFNCRGSIKVTRMILRTMLDFNRVYRYYST